MRNMIDLMCILICFFAVLYSFYNLTNVGYLIGIILMTITLLYQKINDNNTKKNYMNQIAEQRNFYIDTLKHDLSIPILAQLRSIQFLKNNLKNLSKDKQELILENENSCKYILDLINMLIDGKYNEYNLGEKEKFNVSQIIDECLNEIESLIKDKNVKLSKNIMTKNHIIYADKDSIKKVLINLLKNSIKYAHYNEDICISMKTKNQKMYINIIFSERKFLSKFSFVGENISLIFCQKILEACKGSIVTNKDNFKNLKVVIPIA